MRAVLLLACLAITPPAWALGGAPPPTEDICLTVARSWTGSPVETAAISEAPVPDSFVRAIRQTGCSRFQLEDESLVDWHLRFGSEATTAAALAFLAQEYARRDGDRDGTGRNYWLELALFHVRAAEFYRSAALLDAGTPFVLRAAKVGSLSHARPWERDALVRVELRRSVLRALLTRSPANIAAADAIVRSRTTPALEALHGSSVGRPICDRGDDPDDAPIREACGAAGDFERNALAYWDARARLAFARRGKDCTTSGDTTDVDTALALWASRLDPDGSDRGWPELAEERIVLLLLLRADDAAQSACSSSEEDGAARAALFRAERLTSPATAPARFRMIAQRYLALSKARGDRTAAYFRFLLPRLDDIAAADGAALPK